MEKQTKDNIKANIDYHTKLVNIYDSSQPHNRPENRRKVKKILKSISKKTSGQHLLDVGCGTGFILELAHPNFKKLTGLDITPAMLTRARQKFKKLGLAQKIELIEGGTDKMPFSDNTFDVVTGYLFLHHLSNPAPTLKEIYRVLKKGGIFYSDLDPNYYFHEALLKAGKSDSRQLSSLLRHDIADANNITCEITKLNRRLDDKTVRNAEFVTGHEGGFKEEEIRKMFLRAGFKKVDIIYNWFWQEGKVYRETSVKNGDYIEEHLRLALPTTRHLFKYLRIFAVK